MIAILKCIPGGGCGGASGGGEVVVVVVLVLVVRYLWLHSGGGDGGNRLCKGGSCNSIKRRSVGGRGVKQSLKGWQL